MARRQSHNKAQARDESEATHVAVFAGELLYHDQRQLSNPGADRRSTGGRFRPRPLFRRLPIRIHGRGSQMVRQRSDQRNGSPENRKRQCTNDVPPLVSPLGPNWCSWYRRGDLAWSGATWKLMWLVSWRNIP